MTSWRESAGAWRVRCEVVTRRYSVWPFVGLALLAAGAVTLQAALRGLQAQISAQRASIAQSDAAAASRAVNSAAGSATTTPGSMPPSWVIAPPASRQAEDLKRLFAIARQRGLLVAQADYAKSPDSALHVEGLQLQLPLSGSYPQVRRFAEDALRAMPHLSIDQVAFERGAVADPAITARVKLTLWYRVEQSTWPAAAASAAPRTAERT